MDLIKMGHLTNTHQNGGFFSSSLCVGETACKKQQQANKSMSNGDEPSTNASKIDVSHGRNVSKCLLCWHQQGCEEKLGTWLTGVWNKTSVVFRGHLKRERRCARKPEHPARSACVCANAFLCVCKFRVVIYHIRKYIVTIVT